MSWEKNRGNIFCLCLRGFKFTQINYLITTLHRLKLLEARQVDQRSQVLLGNLRLSVAFWLGSVEACYDSVLTRMLSIYVQQPDINKQSES